MSQLTFPITTDGLTLDVMVNADSSTLSSIVASGQQPPKSIPARGLVDTGSDITGVMSSILLQLALPVRFTTTTTGMGGQSVVRIFSVTLFVYDAKQPNLPWLSIPDLLVMELPDDFPVQVLFGLDAVQKCRMFVDGPAN